MADATLGTVLRHLRRLGAARPGDDRSDAQLLDGFLRRRDETAFAALLSRHGPMVLSVCRRVLRHPQDADDAFQATFLVLVRQAEAIRRHDSVASWLYGVALRTAQRARLDAARRRRRDERAAVPPVRPPADEPDWRDLRAVLDEEIARLPEKYRAPLVLCHLEGHSNAQAARRLRVPLGSLSKRLARARGLLRGRLLRRGVALSAAALLTVLAGQGGAAVPPLLARTALGTALLALAGSSPVAAPVAALADGVSRTLLVGQVKAWLLGVAALGLLIGGGLVVATRLTPAAPPGGAAAAPAPGAPAAPPEKAPPCDAPPPRRDRRELEAIKRRLLRRGGSAKSEAAVAAGLLWVVKQQAADGRWSLDSSGFKNDTAATAFGLLPLLGAGHTHQGADPFAGNVRRGLDFLIARQKKDGDFGDGMYAQALASRALFQAYALTGDAKLEAPARAARDYLVKAQSEAGGWRYTPGGTDGDLSITTWQVAALYDARTAGLTVPRQTLDRAAAFVQTCLVRDGGYSYVPGVGTATPTMTAAGLWARAHLSESGGEEAFREGASALTKEDPTTASAYFEHWAAPALWRHGGDEWERWNARTRDLLVSRQEADGGWPAKGDKYGAAGGRLMVSSLTLLALEVYYRDDLPPASLPARPLKSAELESVWSDLASDDPVVARRAAWALAGSPKQSLPLLAGALAVSAPLALDGRRAARLIADLDSDSFDVREQASAALAKLGNAAAPALRQALKRPASAESRRRLETLVEKLDRVRLTPEHRRALWAVAVLEQVGTAEARRLLTRLAKESRDGNLAAAAGAALGRLAESPTGER